MRALIVGGGIGGLAAAIALRRAGVDVTVFEDAPTLAPVGYGIALSPNAMVALDALGVGNIARERGQPAQKLRVSDWKGRPLQEVDLVASGWEMLGIQRADLQQMLLEGVDGAVRLGARCTGFRADASRVTVTLSDGSEERGDVLVGADGIDSTVRAQLHGAGEKRYSGHSAWRASTPFTSELVTGLMNESWGPGIRFGYVPTGPDRLYWFVAETQPAGSPAPPEGAKAAFRRRFAQWHEPIPAIIDATDDGALSKTDVYDRRPLERWGEGRVTLLGDAAHPTTPNLGQGAAQAIEDAVVLGNRFREAADPVSALRAYEARRIPRTTQIVKTSWQLGRMAQLRSGPARAVRNALLRGLPARVQRAQQAKIIGADLS